MAIPAAFNEKSPVNFGPLTAWTDYISVHRGCCAPKILHALEIDQALIAHKWDGGPPKKFLS